VPDQVDQRKLLERARHSRQLYSAAAAADPEASDIPAPIQQLGRVLDTLDAIVKLHAPTATAIDMKPCCGHLDATDQERHRCPICRQLPRPDCGACRGIPGQPARLKDCKDRAVTLATLKTNLPTSTREWNRQSGEHLNRDAVTSSDRAATGQATWTADP
jgi:hypothetical protein